MIALNKSVNVECTSLQPTTSAGCHAALIMVANFFYKRHGTRAATVRRNKPGHTKTEVPPLRKEN